MYAPFVELMMIEFVALSAKTWTGASNSLKRSEWWAATWCRLCYGLRSGDEIGQYGRKVGRIGIFEFVNERPSFRRKVPHRHDLIDIPFRNDSQATDFECRHEHAVRLVVRDLGRGIHADFPSGLLDDFVQDEVLTGQLANEANKNREFDIIEVKGDTPGGASYRLSPRGERKQKPT